VLYEYAYLPLYVEVNKKERSKILWASNPSAGPTIPFSGHPFVRLASQTFDCHHGARKTSPSMWSVGIFIVYV
jgi:hypothetical protein